MLDLVVSSGRILDGTGNVWFPADVGVEGGRIAVIGKLEAATCAERIDAGMIVCPGFIDLHTHSDITLLVNPLAESAVHQGVTTVVVGNCGHSAAPARNALIRTNLLGYREEFGLEFDWTDMAGYLSRLERQGVTANVASLVGHGAIRIAAMGYDSRPLTAPELTDMQNMLRESLEQGAFGLSSGLEYNPGKSANRDELVDLCRVMAGTGGIYSTHIRTRDGEEAIDGMWEAAEVAEKAGVPLHIPHIVLRWSVPNGTERALGVIDAARAKGHDATCDVFPTVWGLTSMAATLPSWAMEGGRARTLEILQDTEARARIKAGRPFFRLQSAGMWDRLMLINAEKSPELVGRTFDEIAGIMGAKDPYDAVLDILLKEGEDFYNAMWMGRNTTPEEVGLALRHPAASIISDGITLAPYGLLGPVRWHPHSYGLIAEVIEYWVGEKHFLTLEEAVRKLTSAPAQRLGLRDRGLLREGMAADLVVLDLPRVHNNATYQEPRRYPSGIEFVVVNGCIVVRQGQHTGLKPGRVLRRL